MAKLSNQKIEITSVYFRNKNGSNLETFPKRMLLNGQEYTFLNNGLRYLVKKSQGLVKLFDVSDGSLTYRLRSDEHDNWTLVFTK